MILPFMLCNNQLRLDVTFHDPEESSHTLKIIKAKSTLGEVPVLLEHQFYNTAVNRVYYACFYATQALLTTKDIFPRTHSSVGVQLRQHFVKPGLFDAAKASFLVI